MDSITHRHLFNESASSVEDPSTNGLLTVKIISMVVLGLSSFIMGILPIRLAKYINIKSNSTQGNNLPISLMLCFGGGVLLFTTFLHLQPEVRESFEKLQQQDRLPNLGNGIPLAELVFCGGFFFVYFIEELVHILLERKYHKEPVLQRSLSLRRCSVKANNNDLPGLTRVGSMPTTKPDPTLPSEALQISCVSHCHHHLNGHVTGNGTTTKLDQVIVVQTKQPAGHSHIITEESMLDSFHGLLAVLALSFHAVFEGLAVGLENNVTKVWYLFAAIATHKLVIAFCVGVELLTSKTRLTLIIVYLGTFAAVTPLGIGLGIVLSEATGNGEHEGGVIPIVLQGMAAGTLLYVVFFEVLAREKSNDHAGVWQLAAIVAGFMVMFALQLATGHEHNHGHDDGSEESHTHSSHTT